eukprot:1161108-Pelagomonas_calceolata.AAC.9
MHARTQVGATTAAALGGARAWAPFAPHAQTLLRLPLDFSMARLPAAVAAAASLARLPRFAGLVRLPTMGSSFVRLPLVARSGEESGIASDDREPGLTDQWSPQGLCCCTTSAPAHHELQLCSAAAGYA